MQRIRDAERDMLLRDFLERGEKIFNGTVKRLDKGDLIVESGRVEGRLRRNEMISLYYFKRKRCSSLGRFSAGKELCGHFVQVRLDKLHGNTFRGTII